MKTFFFLICVTFLLHNSIAQDFERYERKEFVDNQDTLQYRILFPNKIKNGKKYPVVLFLHGAGERGVSNNKQLVHGADMFLEKKINRKHPSVVVFPQCQPRVMWTHRTKQKTMEGDWLFEFPLGDGPTKPAAQVNKLMEEILNLDFVDCERIYIMGLSMGGIGTLEFLYRWPEKYAAAISICGGHNPNLVESYCDIPVWFFHGGNDKVVPSRYSERVYERQKECNTDTKYTFYPEANHNSWDPAFEEPELLDWLFQFKKK